jgi:hypothetical protein
MQADVLDTSGWLIRQARATRGPSRWVGDDQTPAGHDRLESILFPQLLDGLERLGMCHLKVCHCDDVLVGQPLAAVHEMKVAGHGSIRGGRQGRMWCNAQWGEPGVAGRVADVVRS